MATNVPTADEFNALADQMKALTDRVTAAEGKIDGAGKALAPQPAKQPDAAQG